MRTDEFRVAALPQMRMDPRAKRIANGGFRRFGGVMTALLHRPKLEQSTGRGVNMPGNRRIIT
jgi:hypothetical protein